MDRNNIINNYSKSDFMDFLENDWYGDILELFNEEGIELLKNSNIKEERINYILTYSRFRNELLQNIGFLDVLLNSRIDSYYSVLDNLDNKTYEIILNRCLELGLSNDTISRLITFFNEDFKLYAIENKLFDYDTVLKIFHRSYDAKIIQKILDTYNIDLNDERIDLRILFEKGRKAFHKKYAVDNNVDYDISINPSLLNKDVANRLWNTYDIFQLRKILSDGDHCTDISILNKYIKEKEEKLILSSDEKSLLYPYNEIYKYFIIAKEEIDYKDELNSDLIRDARYKLNRLCMSSDVRNLRYNLDDIFLRDGINEVFNHLKGLSDRNLSNYIIDYHFEENYYNINIDLNELLRYYFDGNIVIDRDRVSLYEQIVNIDYLSVEEKKELHNNLKQYNLKELLYDDMRMARDMVNESIKEYSVSSETIYDYKDDELSKKYGVDVFNMNGKEFFGIVKTGRHASDELPTGHSYSLVGSHGIAVFGDSNRGDTFFYDADMLNKEQIVHVFPYDSFTLYKPFKYREEATRRVSVLMTPEEIVSHSHSYTELLILEKGKEETQIDEYIPELKRIALYCLDEITQKDIEIAQREGVGIILIDSSKYEQKSTGNHKINGFNVEDYNYFNGSFDKEKYEHRRL